MHLVVNLANEAANDTKNNVVGNTGGAIKLKINKALLISKRQNMFFNEEYYKYNLLFWSIKDNIKERLFYL